MKYTTISLSKDDYKVPNPVEKAQSSPDDMVPFGSDNLFPQQLMDTIESTPLVTSIIDKVTKYVFGEGVIINGGAIDPNTVVDDQNHNFNDLIMGTINDYITFGALAIQVRRNGLNEIKKLDRVSLERLRTNENNSRFWYHKKWSRFAKTGVVYDAFNGDPSQSDSILYYKNPSGRHVYGHAPYWCAMNDIVTAKALSEYGTNTVNNAFTPSAIITLCQGIPTAEEAKEVEKKLNEKFSGTKNNAKLMVCFADSRDTAPIIDAFNSSDINAHYLSLKDQVHASILGAFNIDGLLIGIHTESGVFAQSSFEPLFKLFNKTEIQPIQQNIKRVFKRLGYDIEFKPFQINWEE